MDKIRILLCEDHTLVREGIRDLINSQDDMEIVGEAANGEEAIQLAGETKPDIVLMDIAMPKLDGVKATRRIKESYPAVSVLILTAHDSEELIFAMVEAGAAGYLLKNVRGQELLNSIRAVHDGESVLHPAAVEKIFKHPGFAALKSRTKANGVLTERELEVLKLAADGLSNEKVAQKLSVGTRTIQTHWRNIFNKLGVSSRTEAIMCGLRNGWIELEKNKEW